MLKINDSVEFSRTSSAVSLVVGALCSLAASLIEPTFALDQRIYLADIAAAADRYQASGVLNALGSVGTVFGLVGVLHLLRGRRVTLGQVGAGLMIMGSVLMAGHWFIVLVETVGAQVDPDRALQLLATASQSPWGALLNVAAVGLFLPVANDKPRHCRSRLGPARRRASRPRGASCPCPTRPGQAGSRFRMHHGAGGHPRAWMWRRPRCRVPPTPVRQVDACSSPRTCCFC